MPFTSIPITHKAYVIQGLKGSVKSIPVPKLGAAEILVKNEAVAINPTDWKHIANQNGTEGAVVGCDIAGTVVAIGDNVTEFKVGDEVFGLVSGSSIYTPENGGFAEYVRLAANRTLRAPVKLVHAKEDSLPLGPVNTWEGASSLPVGVYTALIGFVHYAKIPIKPNSKFNDQYFLVWGGASSLGQAIIQIAKYVGFKVITTASKHNFDLVKELGAEKSFDYHYTDVVEQISKYVCDDLTVAYDAITIPPTTLDVYSVLSKTRESTLLTSLNFDKSTVKKVNPKVTNISFPLAYLCIDKEKKFGINGNVIHSPEGLFEDTIAGIKEVNQLWSENPSFILHMPIKIVHGGLNGLDEALDIVRTGKNSGFKVVVPL